MILWASSKLTIAYNKHISALGSRGSGNEKAEGNFRCIVLHKGASCPIFFALKLCNPARSQFGNLQQHSFATKAEEYDLITGDDQMARVDGHDSRGFLVNKVYLPGSVLCSGRLTTLWAAKGYEGVTIDSLSLLMLMRPPPDLLLLGCGEKMLPPPVDVQKWLASHGVALECLSTANAASTFNILNQEGRAVVGAFLPSD